MVPWGLVSHRTGSFHAATNFCPTGSCNETLSGTLRQLYLEASRQNTERKASPHLRGNDHQTALSTIGPEGGSS